METLLILLAASASFIAYQSYKNRIAVGDIMIANAYEFSPTCMDGVEFRIDEILEGDRYRIRCIKGKVLSTGENMVYESVVTGYVVRKLYIRIKREG